MAEETVFAVHKVTGIISEVPVHILEAVPALEKATEKQLKAAQTKLETEIYGAPLKNGEIPSELIYGTGEAATEGGTA